MLIKRYNLQHKA